MRTEADREKGGNPMESMILLTASATLSCIVSYLTAKSCFDSIDRYVKEITAALWKGLEELSIYQKRDLKNK